MQNVPYDVFTGAFLNKVSEYDFASMADFERNGVVDGYMRRALADFADVCPYAFIPNADDAARVFWVEVPEAELDEIADIASDGMVVQWLKPFVYRQESLQNVLNTRDFTSYSPAELLLRIGEAYKRARREFIGARREYSYRHGDLTELHL